MATYSGITLLDILFRDAENMIAGDHTFVCGDETYPTEVIVYNGNQDWTSSMNLGNSTADARMLVCIVKGDLTIRSGITVTPTTRKRGFFLFCTGTLSNFGNISMTARGASAPGQNVYIWSDKETFDFIPKSSITARAAGVSSSSTLISGNPGLAGINRLPGNGGSGSNYGNSTRLSGAGGLATSYSGGPGGGGVGWQASANGGQGSDAGGAGGAGTSGYSNPSYYPGCGGAGNPGGAAGQINGVVGNAGTGGLMIIFAKIVNLMPSGTFSSNGAIGGSTTNIRGGDGGSSGGGSINIFYEDKYTNSGSTILTGGAATSSQKGGAGGTGSISSKQIIPHFIEDWRFPDFYINGTSLINAISNNVITNRTGAGYIKADTTTWPFDIVTFQGNQIWNTSKNLGIAVNNQEERGLLVVVKGNLTIEQGALIKATSNRRAFIFMVFGHLIINGTLNITARQALKDGTIRVFTGKDIQVDVPSHQRNGVTILYATRFTNNGEFIISGDYRELYYQGLIKEGKCTITTSGGVKDSLKVNRILKDLELETRQVIGS